MFVCELCNKKLKTRGGLRLHSRNVHSHEGEEQTAPDHLIPSISPLAVDGGIHSHEGEDNVAPDSSNSTENGIYNMDYTDIYAQPISCIISTGQKGMAAEGEKSDLYISGITDTHITNESSLCTTSVDPFKNTHGLKTHMSEMHKVYIASTKDHIKTSFRKPCEIVMGSDLEADIMTDVDTDSSASSSASITRKRRKKARIGVRPKHHKKKIMTPEPEFQVPLTVPEKQPTGSQHTRTRRNPHGGTTRQSHLNQFECEQLEDVYRMYPPLNINNLKSNDLHNKLKNYHDEMMRTLDNVATEKQSAEIVNVVQDMTIVDTIDRQLKWSKADQERLNSLNETTKSLPVPEKWFWGAADDTQQGIFNQKRLEFFIQKELQFKILHCPQCQSTGLLVGLDQIKATVCAECLLLNRSTQKREKFEEAWTKVRPKTKTYPTRTEEGHTTEELPELSAGEKALIAIVHPVVTIMRNSFQQRKYKQEKITLLHNSDKIWAKFLPRTDLHNRFIVVERQFKASAEKYIKANPARVRPWLKYLFDHHEEYVRMKEQRLLTFREEDNDELDGQTELAKLLADETLENEPMDVDNGDGITQAAMESGLSAVEMFSYDRYDSLYTKKEQLMKIKKHGKIDIVKDDSERRPTYKASANLCFPHLYANGESSPLDFGEWALARQLLKTQTLYAHTMADGSSRWKYAEDSIHMMHQFAGLTEERVRSIVGFYLSQHPDCSNLPIESVLKAFKDGMNESGLLDSQLPDLSSVMAQIPNTREKWFSEQLGIHAISRDLGDPNLFLTLNMDPRAWPDVRRLIYQLEFGEDAVMDRNWFESNTDKFTELMSKYSVHISIYLCRKVRIFLKAFLCDICRIPYEDNEPNWSSKDRTSNGWYWGRVEHTETRGIQHWHCLAKLPHVLDTALLGRIIHNGRVIRQEIKCANIKPGMEDLAWKMVEMGLLANRYVTLFADSISQASFYSGELELDSQGRQVPAVISLEEKRQEFVENYKKGNISVVTHPIMRTFKDPECNANQNIEDACTAAISCMHHCITNVCGGNKKTGEGCRFSFPKKEMRQTVPAIMQVNADQMEAQMIMKRTCDRIPNLNRYLLKFWRANHDISVLIDAAHKMRYATKYVSKSKPHSELIDEVVEYLSKRCNDLLPPNIKQTLSNLILADCSHRSYLSKQEIAYKVMDLPEVIKSFADIKVVGFYRRSHLIQDMGDEDAIVYSDRTEYSAYAERCEEKTVCVNFDKDELESMNLRTFAETIRHVWKVKRDLRPELIPNALGRKIRTRDINSGHWELTKARKQRHIRWSTVLYSAPAHLYEIVEQGNTTTQTLFYDLPADKRKQLYRAYQELVCYVPWKISPDIHFLSPDIRSEIEDESDDPEKENRYSLRKLEQFHKKYMELWQSGEAAPAGSQWHRDNQHSHTMFLTARHNTDVHMDRVANKGVLTTQYENHEELADTNADLRPPNEDDDLDKACYPSPLNYVPADTLSEILKQQPPAMSDISVAIPLQNSWQRRQEMATSCKSSLFMADPPPPKVNRRDLSYCQNQIIDIITSKREHLIYVYGKAGSGKTELALHICQQFKGRVQAGAGTGKAAMSFRGPTLHAMFGWSHDEYRQARISATSEQKIQKLRIFYEGIEIFVIDEVNAISAAQLGLLDETLRKIFDPTKPFGGKIMVFLGDAAQLRPVCGAAIYDDGLSTSTTQSKKPQNYYSSQNRNRTLRGQELYKKFLSVNCAWLMVGFRNMGLLQDIFDRLRDGKQTAQDLNMLTWMRRKYPDANCDYGIHYSNEACSLSNWRDLWSDCKKQKKRLHVCKARYNCTGQNDLVVSALGSIKPSDYQFAADVLCIAEGCEVRLIKNVNVSAGLVNSVAGTVVKVLYDNADVSALLEGKFPAPYSIIVKFPTFRGFQKSATSDERVYPFDDHTCVPIYKEKFLPNSIPAWIRKKQSLSMCFREQFPLDSAQHITAHRGQGQTWKDLIVSVDLELESPNSKIPQDIGSIVYVAGTRVNQLKHLLLSTIHPTIWHNLGKTKHDETRREIEKTLKENAGKFAIKHGYYRQMMKEKQPVADVQQNTTEWKLILDTPTAPTCLKISQVTPTHLSSGDSRDNNPVWLAPVITERHLGIDQGVRNFAIVAVDKSIDKLPMVVGAELYDLQSLGLTKKFTATELVALLSRSTVLLQWMQHNDYDPLLPVVDRVIVHIEQLSIKNKYSKQFTLDFGKLLQSLVDVNKCVVKLSQPHLHRHTGPMFKLGQDIIDTCHLIPSSTYNAKGRGRSTINDDNDNDIEPDSENDTPATLNATTAQSEYNRKKTMSSDIFTYIMTSDNSDKLELDIHTDVQTRWRTQTEITKFDDLGDALLHALNDILCGTSNYRPLVPSMPSLQVNRSVVVAFLPNRALWIVLNCTWNIYTLEDFGQFDIMFQPKPTYRSAQTVKRITDSLDASLRLAILKPNSSHQYSDVEHVKIIVKQTKSYDKDFTNRMAGALTNSAVDAMKSMCDSAAGNNSKLCTHTTKEQGWLYTRSKECGHKFQVIRSTGKHTNCVAALMHWLQVHAPQFISNRPLYLDKNNRLNLFQSLEQLAKVASANRQLDMLTLSDCAASKFNSSLIVDNNTKAIIADLLLIGLNKNCQYINAIAPNYRATTQQTSDIVEPVASIVTEQQQQPVQSVDAIVPNFETLEIDDISIASEEQPVQCTTRVLPLLNTLNCGDADSHHAYLVNVGRSNGFIHVDTVGGGDCFFDAIRIGCELYGIDRTVDELRLAAAWELQNRSDKNTPLYNPVNEDGAAATYADFVHNTEHGHEWATDMTIAAMAASLNIVIRVISTRESTDGAISSFESNFTKDVSSIGRIIIVGYNKEAKHYTAYLPDYADQIPDGICY